MLVKEYSLMSGEGKVYVVSGPPASGKSFYVKKNKKWIDIVIDIDEIRRTLTGSDNPYHVNKSSLFLAEEIRDLILKKKDMLTLGGRNIWLITGNNNIDEVKKLADDLNAELIMMDTDKETCILNADNDPLRDDKTRVHKQIEDWFSAQSDSFGLCAGDVVQYWFRLKSILEKLNMDYYLTGSVNALINYNVDLHKTYNDIDLFINENDVGKFIRYCRENKIKTISYPENREALDKYGHIICIFPFDGLSFHIGLFLFDSRKTPFSPHTYYEFNGFLHKYVVHFDQNSYLLGYLKDHYRMVPYEWTMTWKLSFARPKDYRDYEKLLGFIDTDIIKIIKKDTLNASYELFIREKNGIWKLADSGTIGDAHF